MKGIVKKHANARIVENFAGIYITCNTFPEYGIEQKNIERRLDIFHTNSLTEKCPKAVCWLKDNAFMVLMWIVNEIKRNNRLIERTASETITKRKLLSSTSKLLGRF